MKDRKERIAAMLAVRDELQKSDEADLWEYYSPESAADMSEISAVQKKPGLLFSKDYIDFLLWEPLKIMFYNKQQINLSFTIGHL